MKLKKIDKLWSEVQRDAIDLNHLRNNIEYFISAYEKLCSTIILDISQKDNLKASQELFASLHKIKHQLSIIEFKYNIFVGDKLYEVIKNFDRLDDLWLQEFWFKKFKQGVIWPS